MDSSTLRSPTRKQKAALMTNPITDPSQIQRELSPKERYFNRELSWLSFNSRVLDEALDKTTPLLERLKFLGIFSTNQDEFFMVRIAGLKKMKKEGIPVCESPEAMPIETALSEIQTRAKDLLKKQYHCLKNEVLPGLEKHGVSITKFDSLTKAQQERLTEYFMQDVFPVLTPLAVDPAHPFPFLRNLALYLTVVFKTADKDGEHPLGFVEIPAIIPRLIEVKNGKEHTYVMLEDLMRAHIDKLFLGFEYHSTYTIRVTRNLDYTLLENEVVDLLKSIKQEMISREQQEAVRLEVDADISSVVLEKLVKELKLDSDDVFKMPRPLFIPGLFDLLKLPLDHLKDPQFNPRLPRSMASNEDIFAMLTQRDLFVHHPYESFYAVVEFLATAAADKNVLAIKQTLYRTSGDSPIINALIHAAENGKQVTAVIELKARFDEKNNIVWARRLERSGVNVVFGFIGLKTHCKATLIVRKEKEQIARYVHLATGNYNSSTAKLYTDIGLFTKDKQMGEDVSALFNILTGFNVLTGVRKAGFKSIFPDFKKLLVAPIDLKPSMLALIDEEIECQRKHGSGLIIAKANGLVDQQIIDKLYEASCAGVKIKLIIRGICCLRPGVPGLSENIEVISIIDRFLEHSRIFYFKAAGLHRVFVGSADLMARNMNRRIEATFPIEDTDIKHRIIHEILGITLSDNVKARELNADGTYTLRTPAEGEEVIRSQEKFIQLAREEGVKSLPYDKAIKHAGSKKDSGRPIAKKALFAQEPPFNEGKL